MFLTFHRKAFIFILKLFSKRPMNTLYSLCCTAQYYDQSMLLLGKFCCARFIICNMLVYQHVAMCPDDVYVSSVCFKPHEIAD